MAIWTGLGLDMENCTDLTVEKKLGPLRKMKKKKKREEQRKETVKLIKVKQSKERRMGNSQSPLANPRFTSASRFFLL